VTTQNTLPSPALLQRHLHRVHYPANRDQLLDHARSECERVIGVLNLMPNQDFSRPTDVSKAFGEIARSSIARANYPARRAGLLRYAQEQGAEPVVIDALGRIPDQEYGSPDAVIIELIEL
jgi:hypothetical protein